MTIDEAVNTLRERNTHPLDFGLVYWRDFEGEAHFAGGRGIHVAQGYVILTYENGDTGSVPVEDVTAIEF